MHIIHRRTLWNFPYTSHEGGYLVSKSSAYSKWEEGLQKASTLAAKLIADSLTKDGEETEKQYNPETKNSNLGLFSKGGIRSPGHHCIITVHYSNSKWVP